MLLTKTRQPFHSITLAETSPQRIARALAHNSCRLSMPECGHLMEIITYSTTFALPEMFPVKVLGSLFKSPSVSLYHRRELPQVSFLSWQTCVCHDKSMLVETKKNCRNKHIYMFVTTKLMLVAAPASDTLDEILNLGPLCVMHGRNLHAHVKDPTIHVKSLVDYGNNMKITQENSMTIMVKSMTTGHQGRRPDECTQFWITKWVRSCIGPTEWVCRDGRSFLWHQSCHNQLAL